MRRLVELFLKMLSHEVESTENGQEAVQKFKSNKYDVILMDMRMPVMDGYQATETIRALEKDQDLPRTVIIALTSFSTQEEISKSLEAGCDTHLVKPVSKDSLQRALGNLPNPEDQALPETRGFQESFTITIDPDLEDLVPGYLEKRRKDIERFRECLDEKDFDELRSMGHKVKGSGGGYGFNGLSIIGADIENAAKLSDENAMKQHLEQYEAYIKGVKVVYEEE
jgi:CheY-like chemotaxis protein